MTLRKRRTDNDAEPAERPREPRWQRRSEARPAEIVSAALELFVERGFAATRMEQIAARAGVTKGTVYLYFRSKEDLFRAALEESLLPTVRLGGQLVEKNVGSQKELLRELILRWWSVVSRPPVSGIPKLITAEAANFPALARFFVENVLRAGRDLFTTVLRRGIEAGEFRKLNVDDAVRLALAPIHSLIIYKHSLACYDDQAIPADRLVELHIDIFLRGIENKPHAQNE